MRLLLSDSFYLLFYPDIPRVSKILWIRFLMENKVLSRYKFRSVTVQSLLQDFDYIGQLLGQILFFARIDIEVKQTRRVATPWRMHNVVAFYSCETGRDFVLQFVDSGVAFDGLPRWWFRRVLCNRKRYASSCYGVYVQIPVLRFNRRRTCTETIRY